MALLATEWVVCGLQQGYAAVHRFDARLSATNPSIGILRSALILHGREMINQAFERQWEIEEVLSGSVQDMVSAGSWYLNIAGVDVEDMLQPANWNAIQERDNSILGLFDIKMTP
jgi:hypothetical protein